MAVLVLDIATKLGWAVHRGPGCPIPDSGVLSIKQSDDESDSARLLNLWRLLNQFKNTYIEIEHVFYEKGISFGRHGKATQVMHRLFGVLELWCALHEIPLDSVNPSTLKKFSTGDGRAEKLDMIIVARRRWPGVSVYDDNQADALMVLSWAMAQYEDQPDDPTITQST